MARRTTCACIALVAALLAGCGQERSRGEADSTPPEATAITVCVAASTADVMRELAREFEATRPVRVRIDANASSTLARQICAGAPADAFLSADKRWMDEVVAAGEVDAGSREDLLANRLVLVAPKGRPLSVTIAPGFDVVGALPKDGRVAIGDPAHVPVGTYACEALESLGWLESLSSRLLSAPDARATVRLVESGEADAGIVYATDAWVSDKVVVVAEFPTGTHSPIRYPLAIRVGAAPQAAEFVRFLRSDEAARLFERAGFTALGTAGDPSAEERR